MISRRGVLKKEQSRRIFGGNFQIRAHDGNKAAGLKVTTWVFEPKRHYSLVCPMSLSLITMEPGSATGHSQTLEKNHELDHNGVSIFFAGKVSFSIRGCSWILPE